MPDRAGRAPPPSAPVDALPPDDSGAPTKADPSPLAPVATADAAPVEPHPPERAAADSPAPVREAPTEPVPAAPVPEARIEAGDGAGQDRLPEPPHPDDVPPATADAPEVRDAWLRRIEALQRDGRIDEARASLAEFRRRHPEAAIPPALQALEP